MVRYVRFVLVLLLAVVPAVAGAQPIGRPSGGGDTFQWDVAVTGHEQIVLTVALPDGDVWSRAFPAGRPVVLSLRDLPGRHAEDGTYTYELRVVPRIPEGVKTKLAAARAAGDVNASAKILKAAGIVDPGTQWGAFQVVGGSIVSTNATEKEGRGPTGASVTTTSRDFEPVTQDQVIPDDLIVQMSLCVGFDCINNEVFGFDTIKLKENNLRIKFEDTSVAPFPTNDWQLTANDSASGGSSQFSIEDVTGLKVPVTVTAGAATSSLFINSTGRIGFRTSTPVLDLHVATGDTPAIRLEQNNSFGWTAQTWDIAGNESNFFVRDVTSGSHLPLRIRPGAPTSSIDVSADGWVGIGTGAPVALLDIRGDNAHVIAGNEGDDFMGAAQTGYGASNGTERLFYAVQTGLGFIGTVSNTNLGFVTNNTTKATLTTAGRLGIGTAAPSSLLHVSGGDIRVSTGSFIDDGTTLNVPDYVFDGSYELMPIEELAAFVRAERHLPNVPSRDDIAANGVNLSKLQMQLLEKIEELTLYTIELKAEIEALKAKQ